MNQLSVFPLKSTYISSQHPQTNYCSSDHLIARSDHYFKAYMLLNFPLTICSSSYPIRWYLYLPLNDHSIHPDSILSISILYHYIDYSTINYQDLHKLYTYDTFKFIINNSDISNKYVLVDISSFIYNYLNSSCSTINIMLGILNTKSSLFFYKNTPDQMPRLLINHNDCTHSSTTLYNQLYNALYNNLFNTLYNFLYNNLRNFQVGMELTLHPDGNNNIIPSNGVIKFNFIGAKSSVGVDYNMETGEILISEKGFYLFSWTCSIQGSTYLERKSIALRNNTDDFLYPYPVPTSIQGQVSGMAFIDINDAHSSFSLINISGGDILLIDLIPSATIIVSRV